MKGGSLILSHKCDTLLSDTDPIWINRIFSDKCVQYFIENISSVRGITNGSLYGVIFTVNLSSGVEDVFINDQVENTGIPIRTLLMKVTYIKHSKEKDQRITQPSGIRKAWTTIHEFKSEAETQQNIYAETSQLGEPVCPSVLHSECLNRANSIRLMNKLYRISDTTSQQYIQQIAEIMTYNPDIVLGISFMDFMDGFQQLHTVLTNSAIDIRTRREVAACSVYQNIRLMSLGYVHSDLHLSNTMVNMSGQNLLLGRPYKCIIIDFGRTVYNKNLVSDILKLKLELTEPYIEQLLSVLYSKYRNRDFPENYLIPSLQAVGMFNNYSEMMPYLLQVFQLRIAKIDELVQQNKYSDNKTALCLRSYINKKGSMVIDGLTFSNIYYIQYENGTIKRDKYKIDIQKKLPLLKDLGESMRETNIEKNILKVLDFDICIYYISKNPHLADNILFKIVKYYFTLNGSGYFSTNCDMNKLYLNAITKSDKYAVGTTINPVLNRFYTAEQYRLMRQFPVTDRVIKTKKNKTLSLRQKRFQSKRETTQQQIYTNNHIQLYNNIAWVIHQLTLIRGQEEFIQSLREYMTLFENTGLPEKDRIRLLNDKIDTFKNQYNEFLTSLIKYKIHKYNKLTQNIESYTARICSHSDSKCQRSQALVNHNRTSIKPYFNSILRDIIDNKNITRIDELSQIISDLKTNIQGLMSAMSAGRRKTYKKSKRYTRKN